MLEDNDRAKPEDFPLITLFTAAQWSAIGAHHGLTPRQIQICKYVCQGQADKNIAATLGITMDTVRMHLREIFRKLGVQSRVKLVVALVLTNRELRTHARDSSGGAAGTRKKKVDVQRRNRVCNRA